MEFLFENKKKILNFIICTRCFFFIFDIFSIIYSFNSIEKNLFFTHYCLTLFTIFISIANLIRYEYINRKNLGRIFTSLEEYNSWQNSNHKNIKYLIAIFEYSFKITLTIHALIIKQINLYTISIIIIQLNTVFNFIGFVIIMMYLFFMSLLEFYRSKQPKNNLDECPICLDKNYDTFITTKCNHKFHEECFYKWMEITPSCPICRETITFMVE